ncbi:hypothetical protein SB861_47285 [Paraburkholderia sp. SIMBA_049]
MIISGINLSGTIADEKFHDVNRAINGQIHDDFEPYWLTSFGVNPRGYIGFFDPQLGKHATFANAGDNKAKKHLTIKSQTMAGRRAY